MSYSIAIFSYNNHQNLLPYALRSVSKNATGYDEIIVVWDDYVRERDVDFDAIRQSTGVDFRVIKHTELYEWPERIGRWGWIKQQLAKLLCYKYSNSDYTWVFDGDVILKGDPELFDANGKPYLRYLPDEKVTDGYIPFMRDYLNMHNYHPNTWVGSTALFDHAILRDIWGKYDLIDLVDQMLESGNHTELPFSEFEIYGNYSLNNFADCVNITTANWTWRTDNKLMPIDIQWANNEDTDLEEQFNKLCAEYS